MSILKVKRLTQSFEKVENLKGISLDLAEGEILTLLGKSGSGKSSLLKCIAGFWTINAGEIELCGSVVAADNNHCSALERNVGYVFQEPCLFPHMSVKKNIGFGFEASKSKDQKFFDRIIELLGLSDFMDRLPHELSGGQMQRVALARALVLKPNILLLDEPFSSLDESFVLEFLPKLKTVLKEIGVACIYVTHRIQESAMISDRVGIMQSGKVLQQGQLSEIYSNPVNLDVARFLGSGFFVEAKFDGEKWSTDLGPIENSIDAEDFREGLAFFRPEDITVVEASPVIVKVSSIEFQGDRSLIRASIGKREIQFYGAAAGVGDSVSLEIHRQRVPIYPSPGSKQN